MSFYGARGYPRSHCSNKGIEADKVKVKVIEKLPLPTFVKVSEVFLDMLVFTHGS